MTLADAKEGASFVVTGTRSEEVTLQAMRFGIGQGARISIAKNIKGGPVIVSRNEMEVAVGRQLALLIEVEQSS